MPDIDKYIDEIQKQDDFFIKAKLLHHLTKEKGMRIIELSKKLGIKPSFICHILRLNRIPEIVIDGYYGKQISISHLFIISRLRQRQQIITLYEKVLAENLTVAQTEEAVREILHSIKTKGSYLTAEEISQFVSILEENYKNSKVKIIQTRIKSKLIVETKDSLDKTVPILKKLIEKLVK